LFLCDIFGIFSLFEFGCNIILLTKLKAMIGCVNFKSGGPKMRKNFLGLLLAVLVNCSFALDGTLHPYPDSKSSKQNTKSSPTCLIKITNDSHDDIVVYGTYDDGVPLHPFMIYAYEMPHYISLYNENVGFCHSGMDIGIETTSGLRLYRAYTWVNTRIRIVSGWFKPYIIMD
jgi:hypothetical protein